MGQDSQVKHFDHVGGSHAPLDAESQVLTGELIDNVTDLEHAPLPIRIKLEINGPHCPGALASTRRCRRGAVRGLGALRGRKQRLGLLQLHDNLLRRVLRELPHGHPFCPATSSRDYSEQPSQNKRSEKPRPLHVLCDSESNNPSMWSKVV